MMANFPNGIREHVMHFLDSLTAGTLFIISGITFNLEDIYKVIMIAVGTTLFIRGFLGIKKDMLENKLKKFEINEKLGKKN